MDPQVIEVFKFVTSILPYVAIITVAGFGGSLLNNWLKIKNGYPLQNSCGGCRSTPRPIGKRSRECGF